MTTIAKPGFRRILRALPVALFVIVALFSCFTAHHFAWNINDSDFASELVLGNFLAGQNKLLSSDWLYKSELRLLSTNLVYMPLFKIFDDWRMVYFIGACVIQLLLVLSYRYLSRQIGLKQNAFFLSASLVLLPICIYYGRFALYQTYYAPCFMMGFLMVGLYLSIIAHRKQRRLLDQGLRLFALFVLAFGSSLNGARQIPGTILPLVLTTIVTGIYRQPKGTSLWEILKRQRFECFLAIIVFLCAVLGFFIHNVILSQYFMFSSATNGSAVIPAMDGIRNILVGSLTFFGFQENRRLFSVEGILALASVFAALVFFSFSVRNLVSRQNHLDPSAGFIRLFFPVAMLLMTMIFLVTDRFVSYHSYYLPVFVWIFPFIGLCINDIPVPLRHITLKQIMICLSCLILFANGIYNNLYFIDPDDKQVTYSYLTQEKIDTLERLQGVVNFIEENEYDVGYATHWQSNIITAMTNGKIPMIRIIRIYPYFKYTYYDCLTYRETRELSFVEDKEIFLLLTRDEADVFSGSELAALAIPIYEDENYKIFTFDFSTEVWDYLLGQAEYFNQTSVLDQLQPKE